MTKAKDFASAYNKLKSGTRMSTAGKQSLGGQFLRRRRAATLRAQRAARRLPSVATKNVLNTGMKTKMPTKIPKASIGGKISGGSGYGKNVAIASLIGAGAGAVQGWNNAAAITRQKI